MNRLLAEDPRPLGEVPLLDWVPPRHGRRIHKSTLFRWGQRGLRGVVLETVQVGGTRCTSQSALWRFFAALAEIGTDSPRRAKRNRRSGPTNRILSRAGIGTSSLKRRPR